MRRSHAIMLALRWGHWAFLLPSVVNGAMPFQLAAHESESGSIGTTTGTFELKVFTAAGAGHVLSMHIDMGADPEKNEAEMRSLCSGTKAHVDTGLVRRSLGTFASPVMALSHT
jgi:hypothetical protein